MSGDSKGGLGWEALRVYKMAHVFTDQGEIYSIRHKVAPPYEKYV